MKKILLFLAAAMAFQYVSSQTQYTSTQIQMPEEAQLSFDMQKEISVSKDYFEGTITYSWGEFKIISTKDGCRFWWEWMMSGLNPQTINSIRIIINNRIVELPFTPEEYQEYSRVSSISNAITFENSISSSEGRFSGRIESSALWYYAKVTVDAATHIELLESIIADPKFNGSRISGTTIINDGFDKWSKKRVQMMLDIYRQLTTEKTLQE